MLCCMGVWWGWSGTRGLVKEQKKYSDLFLTAHDTMLFGFELSL